MAYALITPLSDPYALRIPEVAAQATLWREHRTRLEAAGGLGRFRARLAREWAIETGLIERLYVWDRGTTELLIEQGIDAAILRGKGYSPESADRIKALIDDHDAVVQGLFDYVKSTRELSESYIRELHAALTRSQDHVFGRTSDGRSMEIPMLHGEYKRRPNNPTRPDGSVHEYCPPERVTDEMQRLVAWHAQLEDCPHEVAAAWLHHRFTQIHPFQDGNGRVARALASVVFVKAGLFPLVVRNDERGRYIQALEQADAGELAPLVALFADGQLRACGAALEDSDAETKKAAQRLIRAAAIESLRMREPKKVSPSWTIARDLERSLRRRLREEADEITESLREVTPPDQAWKASIQLFHFGNIWGASEPRVLSALDVAGLRAVNEPRARKVGLQIRTDSEFCAWFVFTAVEGSGREGAACFVSTTGPGPTAELGVEPFVILGAEDPTTAAQRFEQWMEEALVLVLEAWRRGLNSAPTE